MLDAIEANADRAGRASACTRCTRSTTAPTCTAAIREHLLHVSYFLSPVTRPAFHERGCELVPNHFSEVPRLLRETTRCSLVLAAAAPMDRHGYFSLGTNCDYVAPFIGAVPFFLEVNERMPRTFGAQPGARQPGRRAGPRSTDRSSRSRRRRHRRSTSGSPRTSPSASPTAPRSRPASARSRTRCSPACADHRDLGVHTELLSDALIDLIERGVVTGTRKRLARARS